MVLDISENLLMMGSLGLAGAGQEIAGERITVHVFVSGMKLHLAAFSLVAFTFTLPDRGAGHMADPLGRPDDHSYRRDPVRHRRFLHERGRVARRVRRDDRWVRTAGYPDVPRSPGSASGG